MPVGILFLFILFLIKYTVHSLLSVSITTYFVTTPSELLKTRYLLGTLCVNYMMIHTADAHTRVWLDWTAIAIALCFCFGFWHTFSHSNVVYLLISIGLFHEKKIITLVWYCIVSIASCLSEKISYYFVSLSLQVLSSITVRKARFLSFFISMDMGFFLNAGIR